MHMFYSLKVSQLPGPLE